MRTVHSKLKPRRNRTGLIITAAFGCCLIAFLLKLPGVTCPNQLECPVLQPRIERINNTIQIEKLKLVPVPAPSPPCPTCNCSNGIQQQQQQQQLRVEDTTHERDTRPKVAISLLLSENSTLASIETLVKSDIMQFAQIDIFAFSNAPTAPASQEFLTKTFPESLGSFSRTLLTVHNVTFDSSKGWYDPRLLCDGLNGTENIGIIIPRIRIMLEVLKGDYQWLLEAHDDALYPKQWFEALLRRDGPNIGLMMPKLIQQNVNQDLDASFDYEPIVAPLKTPTVSASAAPVHPWLLKLDMIRDVGYYDPMLSPWGYEDHDLFYAACYISDWRCYSVGDSIVHHRLSRTWTKISECRRPINIELLMEIRYLEHNWLMKEVPVRDAVWLCGAANLTIPQQNKLARITQPWCDKFMELTDKNLIDVWKFVRTGKRVQDWRWNRTAHVINFTTYE